MPNAIIASESNMQLPIHKTVHETGFEFDWEQVLNDWEVENVPLAQKQSAILDVALSGLKISAIALVRELHKCDLKTAKEIVEAMVNPH